MADFFGFWWPGEAALAHPCASLHQHILVLEIDRAGSIPPENHAKKYPSNEGYIFTWWPGAESNCRHEDFQSTALPTELPGLMRCEPRIKPTIAAAVKFELLGLRNDSKRLANTIVISGHFWVAGDSCLVFGDIRSHSLDDIGRNMI